MDKRVYIIEYIDYFGEPSEINLLICGSLEEAKDKFQEIVDDVCLDIENGGEDMNDWTDSDGRSKEYCIKKGKFYVEDLFYAEIIKVEPDEVIKIST